MKKLGRKFFEQPTLEAAQKLLGCEFVVGDCSGIITETEAYIEGDPATHSTRGQTKRNAVMFGPPGTLYVYFTYGMHFCANFVCGKFGVGDAVLLRGIVPTKGIQKMQTRRNRGSPFRKTKSRNKIDPKNLTNGPSKICQAFGIDLRQNGHDLCTFESEIFVLERKFEPKFQATPRIGIKVGQEKLWRFICDISDRKESCKRDKSARAK